MDISLEARQRGFDARPKCWLNDVELGILRASGTKIGQRCYIDRSVSIDRHQPTEIEIGDDVILTGQGVFLTHDASPQIAGLPGKKGHIKIGNKVFIGYRSIMLCGTSVGDNCIVGAGSVITNDIPSGEVWAGNPAHKIYTLDEYREKHAIKRNV